jgi:threonine synthase
LLVILASTRDKKWGASQCQQKYQKAIATQQASQGQFTPVTDEEILEAYRLLASQEGVFCEPASAASVAGLLKVKDQAPTGATVVCVLTGKGLKDPDTAIKHCNNQFKPGISPDIASVAQAMGF